MKAESDGIQINENFKISKLSTDFDLSTFQCGVPQLDDYLKKYAILNQNLNIGQTYILHIENNNSIIGYYTISAANVSKMDFPIIEKLTTRLPKYPIPCILIGKLAIDEKYKKNGLGKLILRDALRRVKSISDHIGCFAVIVDSLESATSFYEKYGFIKFINKPLSYFLPIKTIEIAENISKEHS